MPARRGEERQASRRRRAVALAVAAAIGSTGLAACGGSAQEGGSSKTLTWYINPDGGGLSATGKGQAQLAAQCSKDSGGEYSIRVQQLPNSASDQRDQLLRRLAAGDTSMDIMSIDPVFVPEFAQAGYLAPVPAELQEDFTADRVDGALKASRWKDELVSVPMWSNTQLLWYRESVARAAGVDPSKGITWAQLIDAARSQKKTVGVQAMLYEGYVVWINALVEGAGGHIIENPGGDADQLQYGLDSEAGRKAAQIIRSVADSGVGGPAMGSSDETVALNLFTDPQTSGFLLNWPYVWAATAEADFRDDIKAARYPATVEGTESKPPYGGIQLGVGAKSRNVANAYKAVQCITSEEHQKLYMLGTGNPASRKAVYDDPDVKEMFPMAATIRESLDAAAPRPQSQFYGDVSTALQKTFSPPGSVDPQTTPGQAQTLIKDVLKGEALL